jgi:hypothetical protein
MPEQNEQQGMHKRRITLADGRYLIFYTFDDLPAGAAAEEGQAGTGASRAEPQASPQASPQAEEERRV